MFEADSVFPIISLEVVRILKLQNIIFHSLAIIK